VADVLISAPVALEGPPRPEAPPPLSRRNILLYGTLIVVALYYLLPLYVMIVTSLKGMPEVRMGNIFAPPWRSPSSPGSRPGPRPAPGSTATG
jgi:glucose/mannose transport system permease protein